MLLARPQAHYLLLAAGLAAGDIWLADLIALAIAAPIGLPALGFASVEIGRAASLRQEVARQVGGRSPCEQHRHPHLHSASVVDRIASRNGGSSKGWRAEAQNSETGQSKMIFHLISSLMVFPIFISCPEPLPRAQLGRRPGTEQQVSPPLNNRYFLAGFAGALCLVTGSARLTVSTVSPYSAAFSARLAS